MSPRPKVNTTKTEVFLPDEAVQELRKEAEKKGLSMSGLIRMIVLEYLNKK